MTRHSDKTAAGAFRMTDRKIMSQTCTFIDRDMTFRQNRLQLSEITNRTVMRQTDQITDKIKD